MQFDRLKRREFITLLGGAVLEVVTDGLFRAWYRSERQFVGGMTRWR